MPAASKQVSTPDIPIPEVLEKVKVGKTTVSFLLTGDTGKLVSASYYLFLGQYEGYPNNGLGPNMPLIPTPTVA